VPKAIISFLFFSRSLLQKYNLVILSGHYSVLSCFFSSEIFRIHYCHSIPQFAFYRKSEYLKRYSLFCRPFILIFITSYKFLYLQSLKKVDLILANSLHTRSKLSAIGFDSKVLYPPVDIDSLQEIPNKGYYLSIGRLEKNKRIDLIIEAFIKMPEKNLIITSGGSMEAHLKDLANNVNNIQFTGWVEDRALQLLIKESIACIYIPREEDFGMSSIEAMAFGKPVIGTLEGGQTEVLLNMVNGIALPENPSIKSICNAVNVLDSNLALTLSKSCHLFASKFSSELFAQRLLSFLPKK
jgi:glycosyltransferase involved in cell wall biosynthesis